MALSWQILLSALATSSLVVVSPALAQNTPDAVPRTLPPAARYEVSAANSEMRVDGLLNEAAWRAAAPIPLEYEWTPGDNSPPPVESTCYVTYDGDNLYVGCSAADPEPTAIRAHLADRDATARLAFDDHFVFLLDPFNDQRRGFQFRVNARGVQADALFSTAEGIEDFSWDAIWDSAARLTESGYQVEVAIPFRSLRFLRTAGPQTWGFVAERSYPRSVRHRIQSAPRDLNNPCLLCQANKLTGFEGITPGRNVELAPTLTSSRTDGRDPFPAGSLTAGDLEAEAGLDARWGITPNLSLNAAVNPDFSHVEADVAQLDVNTRFALFFPEKRPFFLESADVFTTPINAVFTRTVADPLAGVKLTGKAGASAIGVFAARDRITNLTFPANQGSAAGFLDQDAYSLVGRYRHDVGGSSSVGALVTARHGEDYRNDVAGGDAFLHFTRSNSLRAQLLLSSTEYPRALATSAGRPASTFAGSAAYLELVHASRNWFAQVRYEDWSPDFRADLGFVPRVDVRSLHVGLSRVLRRASGWFTQINISPFAQRTEDHSGRLTDQYAGLEVFYQGPSQTQFQVEVTRAQELFADVLYGLSRAFISVNTRPTGDTHFGGFADFGDAIDFANARASSSFTFGPFFSVNLFDRLSLEASYRDQRLTYRGDDVFHVELLQPRVVYHLGRRAFVRAIVQYRRVDRTPSMYSLPVNEKDESVLTQFLFSYKVNPQTVWFLGYGDNHLGTERYDMTQQARTFFAKLGYAWRP